MQEGPYVQRTSDQMREEPYVQRTSDGDELRFFKDGGWMTYQECILYFADNYSHELDFQEVNIAWDAAERRNIKVENATREGTKSMRSIHELMTFSQCVDYFDEHRSDELNLKDAQRAWVAAGLLAESFDICSICDLSHFPFCDGEDDPR